MDNNKLLQLSEYFKETENTKNKNDCLIRIARNQ